MYIYIYIYSNFICLFICRYLQMSQNINSTTIHLKFSYILTHVFGHTVTLKKYSFFGRKCIGRKKILKLLRLKCFF